MADRVRDLGGQVGHLTPGQGNRITDVPGVRVGHSQAASGHATGVTVIDPPSLPLRGATVSMNGVGELTGNLEINERGRIETPVYLCGSHAIGTVLQAAINLSGRGPQNVVLPVVGECDDGDLADSRTVVTEDVDAAIGNLGSDVPEGTVGAGTGMNCFDFPGGIGTASRRVGEYTVGVLLLCNFGDREHLDFLGYGFPPPQRKAASHGSCIAVCATDAPLPADQLRRLALRPLLGLIRAGSYAAEGSGEIGMAFTTASDTRVATDAEMNSLFIGAWESGWEAVLNCLVAAKPATRLDGTVQDGFPVEAIREYLAGRADGYGARA